jgi:putative endonuclease
VGSLAELAAARHLAALGYVLVDADVRLKCGQVDLVMRDGPTIVIVEVKARRPGRYGEAREAVSRAKLQRLVRLAELYAQAAGSRGARIRIDVVAVDLDAAGHAGRCVHIKDVLV